MLIFSVTEESGVWSEALTFGFLSLIPKPDSDGTPATLGPLSILSTVYRLLASTRLQELIRWQESWIHNAQHGFRQGHSTMDTWYNLAVSLEPSLLSNTPICGCFLDFEKAFDLLPLHEILLPLARPFVQCLGNCYPRLQRFVKFSKGFTLFFRGHRFDPVQACHLQALSRLRSMCIRRPEIFSMVSRVHSLHAAFVFLQFVALFTRPCRRSNPFSGSGLTLRPFSVDFCHLCVGWAVPKAGFFTKCVMLCASRNGSILPLALGITLGLLFLIEKPQFFCTRSCSSTSRAMRPAP